MEMPCISPAGPTPLQGWPAMLLMSHELASMLPPRLKRGTQFYFLHPSAKMAAKTHNFNFAMRKYMLLQEQYMDLCTQLQQLRPCPHLTSSTCANSLPATSPTQSSGSTLSMSAKPLPCSSGRRYPKAHACCRVWEEGKQGSGFDDNVLDQETLYEIYAVEKRLLHVNDSIKRELTELLNCDIVRSDMAQRAWAQARLLETEKELRLGRHRNGSPSAE